MKAMNMSIPKLHPILEEAFKSSQVTDDNGNSIPLDSNISKEEAELLAAAVRDIRPLRSVEIGLAKGVSTIAILNALNSNGVGKHVVLDPFQDQYGNAGIEMVKRAGLEPWWDFHKKFAEEVLPNLQSIQFAFIDASHLFDLSLAEFVLVDKKLDVGGVIGFHDMWMPSLQKLLRFILLNRSYEVWCPAGFSHKQATPNLSLKRFAKQQIKKLPFAAKIVSPELLTPWETLNVSNLVMIKKTAQDDRDWQHFQSF